MPEVTFSPRTKRSCPVVYFCWLLLGAVCVLPLQAGAPQASGRATGGKTYHSTARQGKTSRSSDKLPRSMSATAVPDVTGKKVASSQKELSRLEHQTMTQGKASHTASHDAKPTSASKTGQTEHSRPINFAHQQQRTKGSSNPAPKSR